MTILRTLFSSAFFGLAAVSGFDAALANEGPKMCIDVGPPPPTGNTEYALINRTLKWPNGSTLRIRFLNGSPSLQNKVAMFASEWTHYANLNFEFVENGASDIRIRLGDGGGAWSNLGIEARQVPASEPTMNFGWFTDETPDEDIRGTTLHEFGHALSMNHEHQSPAQEICWNKPRVYEYYAGPPNNWSRGDVDYNLFKKYSKTQSQFSAYDPDSIMHYSIDRALLTCDRDVGWNKVLSETDKTYIAIAYPRHQTINPQGSSGLIADGPRNDELNTQTPYDKCRAEKICKGLALGLAHRTLDEINNGLIPSTHMSPGLRAMTRVRLTQTRDWLRQVGGVNHLEYVFGSRSQTEADTTNYTLAVLYNAGQEPYSYLHMSLRDDGVITDMTLQTY